MGLLLPCRPPVGSLWLRHTIAYNLNLMWESLGAADDKVELVEYRDEWPSAFKTASRRILEACKDAVVHVEHIGSTAIPGLIAKPILDVLLGLNLTKDERIVEPMMNLGYEFLGEYGIPGRSYFVLRSSGREIVHAYAFAIADDAWTRHLFFLDYLRQDPEAQRQYATLKRELAEQFPHERDAYTGAKTDFIRSIEKKAT